MDIPKLPRFTTVPSESQIALTHKAITPFLHRTPVLTSRSLDELAGCKLFFKCDNFQKLGAFKLRGALARMFAVSEEERKKGVFTSSSGNFAQAFTYASRLVGLTPLVSVPSVASQVKKEGVRRLGGELYDCGPTLATRLAAEEKLKKGGKVYISSSADYNVIAGQATSTKELVEDVPNLNVVIAPVSGGGVCSGACLAAHNKDKSIKVYAAEPELADDCYQSMKAGELRPHKGSKTIAEGLRVNISPTTFQIFQKHLTDVLLVSEEEIVQAMKLIFERLKIVVQTSSATVLAAVLRNKERFKGKRVGLIITGGNVDVNNLPFQTFKPKL